MKERERRILATAVELAEEGGFENVRLREVAASSRVALGTLYRHFRSKEDLLVAALAQAVEDFEQQLLAQPAPGETPLDRVSSFFQRAADYFCSRANLSRAVLRALTSGEPTLTERLGRFQADGARMIITALRGPEGVSEQPPTPLEATLADVMNYLWLGVLVGWAGGLLSQEEMVQKLHRAVAFLLAGAGATPERVAESALTPGPA